MARLSFEKKRVQQPAVHPAAVAVRVFGAGGASVGGTSVIAAPGEEIQQAVLNHLQRLAISLGAPIRATIHDDRTGCVVPLEVSADGSSRVTGRAVRVAAAHKANAASGAGAVNVAAPVGVAAAGAADVVSPAGVAAADRARDVPLVEEPEPLPAWMVHVPTGQFGPAPVMPVEEAPESGPGPRADAPAPSASTAYALPASTLMASLADPAPAPTHTPARGFDAVAEEVLGDGPVTETAEGAELLTEPMTRINEAVRAGRIEAAAELADRTVTEASTVLGPRHAEVLHLRELAAYIAYLGGDTARAFQLSLDLARLRRQERYAEAAYGNVLSAATAWRAVRDPEEGLRLGRDLIELWTELTTEPGPAAEDLRPLESARARMVRLTDRAARATQQ
ncbi:hypothetical protein GCM10010260_67680 [Streptomyces filipinensis]|uniref:Uncharacterized protein n=1 Tax=Streptomyces filipinensis TaxID=66887 RepID=A0A918II32_9ACTN|nr:hypothetical protein [Streptomyces filipinensis]GGV18342.1 hypothetical protein GCM10010260_67680 [Streptomyces filipinensis]